METTRKTVQIKPSGLRTTPPQNYIKMEFFLVYDDRNIREITIEGPLNNFKVKPLFWNTMKNILTKLIKMSGWSLEMTYSDFLNFELKRFPNLKITNKLL